jgi:tetratricopeptide (TPR) repeat protein
MSNEYVTIADTLRAFFLCAFLASCAFAQSPLDQSVTLARARHYREARKMLEGVKEPSEINQRIAFHRLKAAIASGLNDGTVAAGEMRLALSLAPSDRSLLLATALAELQAGLLPDAVRHAEQAGEAASEQYRIGFAFELIKRQAFTPAIDLLKTSAPLFPHSGKLRTLLGIAEYATGETKDAQQSFEDAIAVDPKLDSAYACLAQIVLQSSATPPPPLVQSLCAWNGIVCSALKLRSARETGDSELQRQAIAGLKVAPEGSAVGRCELARAYEWTGQLEQARTEMETCVRLDPIPQNHYRLGLLYQKLGLTALAHREMELRSQTLQKMSEETALGLNALQSFEKQPEQK